MRACFTPNPTLSLGPCTANQMRSSTTDELQRRCSVGKAQRDPQCRKRRWAERNSPGHPKKRRRRPCMHETHSKCSVVQRATSDPRLPSGPHSYAHPRNKKHFPSKGNRKRKETKRDGSDAHLNAPPERRVWGGMHKGLHPKCPTRIQSTALPGCRKFPLISMKRHSTCLTSMSLCSSPGPVRALRNPSTGAVHQCTRDNPLGFVYIWEFAKTQVRLCTTKSYGAPLKTSMKWCVEAASSSSLPSASSRGSAPSLHLRAPALHFSF